MKKLKFLTLTLAIIIGLSAIFIATKSFATELYEDTIGADLTTTLEGEEGELSEETETIPDIYEGDLYVAFSEENLNATNYVMDKYVDGNVFIIGNDVKITGQVNGSLFVCASKVTFDEEAYIVCHTFVAAQEVYMSGVTTDMYAVCGSFNMEQEGIVSRDLKLATTNAVLMGSVGRNVNLAASTIQVFEDEEKCFYVGGNLEYTSGSEIEHINDITVKGEVKFTQENDEVEDKNVIGDIAYGALESIVYTLIIYVLLVFLAPKFIEKTKEYVSKKAIHAGAIGLAFTIAVPIVAFILLLTVVGVWVAFLAVFIYVIVLMLNSAIITIALNQFITNKFEVLNARWKKFLMIIPISLVIYLIKQIPFVGGWVSVIIFLVGVGIVIQYQFTKRKKEAEIE